MINFKQVKPIEVEFQGEKIEVNQYIKFKDKQVFVDLCVNDYFIMDENGKVIETSDFDKDLTYFYCIMHYFTNLEISEKDLISDVYDNIVGSGLFDLICKTIPSDIKADIDNKIYNSIYNAEIKLEEEMKKENSIQNIIVNTIQGLMERIPNEKEIGKLIKKAKKEFENFNPEKLKVVKDLYDFSNGKSEKSE